MELYERIKILRRDQRLSQEAFGARLGVSRSVINNLERNVLVNQNSILPLVKLMAKEFCVSEAWLFHGETPKPEYLPTVSDVFSLLRKHGATEYEAAFLSSYLKLDVKQREVVLAFFDALLAEADRLVKAKKKNPNP